MAVFSKLSRPGKGPVMVMRGDRLIARWDGGEATGVVSNCGGFLGDEEREADVDLDLGLVWTTLGRARRRAHDWILLESPAWPSGTLMDGRCEVVVDSPKGEVPFGPMTLAGWLARPGVGVGGLLVLVREG